MGLIKDLAEDKTSHYSDKWLRAGNAIEEKNDDEGKTLIAFRAYRCLQLLRQLPHNDIEPLELLEHAGDVLAGEAADRLQIWTQERGVQ